ncbi:peptidase C39 family protein [Streptomyces sp. NPDC051940]|uniref:peptidase C39 family protein n=1 Tax=Streptomyces sp. NPDC051940 TaxID=3155675 RepID=UPI003434150F
MPAPATPLPRRTVLAAAVAAAAAIPASAPATAAAADRALGHRRSPLIDHHDWSTAAGFRAGVRAGIRISGGALCVDEPRGSLAFRDPHLRTKAKAPARWEYATWLSPRHALPEPGATEAVVSWNAETPPGTWIQIELRGRYSDGTRSPWLVMGRWASGDGDIRRASVDGQSDRTGSVATDTFALTDPVAGTRLTSYRVRVTLFRRQGLDVGPRVRRVSVMASALPPRSDVPASAPGVAAGRVLDVPRYSQETHAGQYPQYDRGGEAWCSPTSSQMVLEYWGRRPTPEQLSWVDGAYADPQVCHAARHTFDYQYKGCGNWPFNAAYAATYPGMNGVVTRLGSLADAEELVAAGIPVITSMSFRPGELRGASYGTSGHIMVVAGFTAAGDVVVNDPAAPVNKDVRRVYGRRSFENIWLRTRRLDRQGKETSGPGGIAYLYWPDEITPAQRAALATAAGVRAGQE